MFCNLGSEFAPALMPPRSQPKPALITGIVQQVRDGLRRRRQRRELRDYIASDHRASADIGVTVYDAREWSTRPFWRS